MSFVKTWATAISKNQSSGWAIIYRYIQNFDASKAMAKHKFRIIVVWTYEGLKGMPDDETKKRMDILENALDLYMNEGEFSTLTIVSTGDNLREWTYYAASEDEFFSRLNTALADKEIFPIKLHAAIDQDWTTYKDFKNILNIA
jgi:hypothetical protein